MKKTNLLFAILGVMLLASCKSEIDCPENPLSTANQVRFNSTIGEMTKTRASGTTWDAGDAIGVYALNAGQTLSDQAIYDGKANIKHTTAGDGVFAAATEAITFPESGNLDFVAYYPYQTTVTGYAYPVNVADQSVPAAIDVLYSDNAKGANKNNTPVSLVFKHMLSQLVLSVSAGDGVSSLDGLTAKVEGLKIDGSMNLVNGVVTIGTTAGVLTPTATVTGASATVNAIIVPGQDLNSAKFSFTLNGKVYEWTPATQALESGKKYTYLLKLSTTGVVTVQPEATITDWEDGYTGTSDIVLTPNEDPQFVTDKTTVSLPATGTLTDVVKLTTESDQAWTAVSNQSWLTLSDASGTGSKDITLTAAENTTTSERTATVTITAGGSASFAPIVVTVTQAAKKTEVSVVFYEETFTNAAPEKIKFNSEGNTVSGFDYAAGLYTGTGTDVRSTSKINKHIWFPAYNANFPPAYVKISNIQSGYTNIKLTYDLAANAADIPANRLKIKCNGTDVTPPTATLGLQNVFSTFTIDVSIDDVTTLEFYTDDSNSSGFRLDNIKLEGIKK